MLPRIRRNNQHRTKERKELNSFIHTTIVQVVYYFIRLICCPIKNGVLVSNLISVCFVLSRCPSAFGRQGRSAGTCLCAYAKEGKEREALKARFSVNLFLQLSIMWLRTIVSTELLL